MGKRNNRGALNAIAVVTVNTPTRLVAYAPPRAQCPRMHVAQHVRGGVFVDVAVEHDGATFGKFQNSQRRGDARDSTQRYARKIWRHELAELGYSVLQILQFRLRPAIRTQLATARVTTHIPDLAVQGTAPRADFLGYGLPKFILIRVSMLRVIVIIPASLVIAL